jgi:uroporphyrinogen decarboxylase
MNGYERTMAALRGNPHDKTPVMLHNFMMAAREANISMGSFRENPKLIAQAFIHAVEKYDYDAILVDVDTVTLAGSLGVPVDFPEKEPAPTSGALLDSLEDLNKLQRPKVENYRYIQNWLEAVRLLRQHFGNEILIRGNCDQAPFSLASMLRGANNLMLDFYLAEPQRIIELLEYCTEATCQFIRLMSQAGAHMLSNGDSVASPEMISPEQYEEFALPYEKRVIEVAHQQGLPYALHICGNTDMILERMLKSNADAFEIDYKTDNKKAFDILYNQATFIGNIDPSGVIALGTPDLVRRKTTELLDIFSTTNRFILNSGCAIPAITPEENIFALIETARNYERNIK